jgi:hypothetical protein
LSTDMVMFTLRSTIQPRLFLHLDSSVPKHKCAKMRTTIEIPDELYRSLKARAALKGVPVREVVTQLIDQGLRAAPLTAPTSDGRREPPPVAIPPRGTPIQALSHSDRVRAEEIEDEARHARSA